MDTITITLPDGSEREYDAGVTGAQIASSIGRGLAKAALAVQVDGETVDLTRPIDHDAKVAVVTGSSPEGREVLRHSTAHVMAQAVFDLFPGAKYAIGPGDRRRLLLRLRAARRRPLPRHGPRAHRDAHARDRQGGPALRPGGASGRRGRGALRRPAVQARDHRQRHERCRRRGGRRRGDRPRCGGRVPQPARRRLDRLRRPLPRPARPDHGQARCVQAHPRRRCLLARRREARAAPTDLRHRVGEQGRARRAPAPTRGGRAPGPPQARGGARPVLLPGGDRLRARGVPPEGRDRAQGHGGLLAPAPRGRRVRVRELTAHHEVEPLRDQRSPRLVRGRHVPADGARRRHGLLPQADELPVPHPDLPEPDAQLPRAAHAALRVRDRVPVREVRCRARAHAGPRDDPGRRAHLLHEGAGRRGAHLDAALRPRTPARLRARRLLPRAVHQARGQGGRDRRGVGAGHRSPSARPR